MAETKVLVIDADEQRADTLVENLRFIEQQPVVAASLAEVATAERHPQEFSAIILGQDEDEASLLRFGEWLMRDRYHPPLLVAARLHEKVLSTLNLDRSACLALDYPVRYTQLIELLRRAQLLQAESAPVKSRAPSAPMGPTGNSALIRATRRMIEQVAPFDSTVLVTGESGTGKEVVARAVHAQSGRRDKPFVAVNCGAIPAELLESELFGHEKGAFTGAITTRRGRFEMAEGGTLFLDEIGDMSLPMQVKILRVLQEHTYERVGSSRSQHCDVRIIAATHRDLEASILRGTFLEDLYYRLNVFPIELPPLRERLEDLPMMVGDLIAAQERNNRGSVRLTADAVHALRSYHWPGNVRELANVIERLTVLHPTTAVTAADLPARYRGNTLAAPLEESPLEMAQPPSAASAAAASLASPLPVFGERVGIPSLNRLPSSGLDLKEHIEAIEISLIQQALEQAGGVVAHAAKLLNTRRTTLVEKLRKYGLHREFAEREKNIA